MTLSEQFGPIDIYLFDQLLKGRITHGMRIFDAGCGNGRNLVYFLREGFSVSGADENAQAVASVLQMARSFGAPADIRAESLTALSFPKSSADVVISSAVLHFAYDEADFEAMLRGSWSMLARGGLFFCRLASSIGIERLIRPVSERRFLLPDGSERYLVDEVTLMRLTAQLNGSLLDPIKTTVVQNQRSMTTWVVRKH